MSSLISIWATSSAATFWEVGMKWAIFVNLQTIVAMASCVSFVLGSATIVRMSISSRAAFGIGRDCSSLVAFWRIALPLAEALHHLTTPSMS